MKNTILLLILFSSLAVSQSKPKTSDSLANPSFSIVYGDTILSKEDPSVLAAIVRLKQLHDLFVRETGLSSAGMTEFMVWIDLRLIHNHSPAFTKKLLTERAGLSKSLPPGNR